MQELLQLFDLDLDFPAGRLRLFSPGEGLAAAAAAGLAEVPAAVLNETGVLGIRATSAGAAAAGKDGSAGWHGQGGRVVVVVVRASTSVVQHV